MDAIAIRNSALFRSSKNNVFFILMIQLLKRCAFIRIHLIKQLKLFLIWIRGTFTNAKMQIGGEASPSVSMRWSNWKMFSIDLGHENTLVKHISIYLQLEHTHTFTLTFTFILVLFFFLPLFLSLSFLSPSFSLFSWFFFFLSFSDAINAVIIDYIILNCFH